MPPIGESKPAKELPAARTVQLKTADRMALAGTFWPAEQKAAPGVVLLHMFRSKRQAWEPAVKALRARGIAVLAIDMRGHGESSKQGKKDLSALVARRDPKLFEAMHADAFAAIEWLVSDGGCDKKRIALMGASVGCSVAIDTTRRHPEAVAAVLCMTPGAKYLGLDTLAHLKSFPATTPLLLLSHRSEIESGTQQIAAARPSTAVIIYDDEAPKELAGKQGWAHGTHMFGRLPIVRLTTASFLAAKTGSKSEDVVLDGVIATEGEAADGWPKAVKVSHPDSPTAIYAFRVGRRVLFGGKAPKGYAGLRFEVQSGFPGAMGDASPKGRAISVGPPQVVCIDIAKSLRMWSWGGMGSVPNMPGMDTSNMFGKTYPILRAVPGESGITFEGEWRVPAMGGGDDGQIRLFIGCDKQPYPRPRGAVPADLDNAKDLPAR